VRYTTNNLTIVEGLEVIRRRPSMYIGAADSEGSSLCPRLLEVTLNGVVDDVPAPSAIRVTRFRDGTLTIAWDGAPLPIGASQLVPNAVAHPDLYRFFLHLHSAEQRLGFSGAIVNALSERLVVSTVHEGDRYRVVFSRGMLVSLLAQAPCEVPLGSNWLTFLPDNDLLGAAVSSAESEEIVARFASRHLALTILDRSSDEADWY
jgi:DNA gyrase subunit B